MTSSPVAIGSLIAGKYRVERILGQGGMGVVVVAMHDELDQRVAIKFLLPEAIKDAEWVARFSREAKAAAKIKSEHVVRVFDVGKLPDGAPYMVMEFLDGKDLQSILNDRHHFSVEEAVDFVLQACEALAEAHAAGIVHRDLKPANLFLAHRSDGSPCVKVLDFGISKVTAPGDVSMTSTQAIVGSPLYMSPEQMKAAKNVDRRSDIWSIGVLLQELVSGTPSFTASTSAELCALVLTAPPTPLRTTLPNAPVELERVIARCLEKNVDARYANVGELARDLLPLAPGATTSVDRILRMSGSAPRPSLVDARVVVSHAPPGVDPGLSTTEATIPATNVSPTVVGASSAPTNSGLAHGDQIAATQLSASGSGALPAMAPGAATNAAWGSPTKPPAQSRTMLYLGAAVALVAVLGGGAYAIARSSGTPSTTSPAQSAPEHAATSIGAGTPTITTAAVATTTTTAAATTSSPPSIALSSLPTVSTTARPHASVAVSPPPSATTKPATSASTKTPPTVNTSGFGGRN